MRTYKRFIQSFLFMLAIFGPVATFSAVAQEITRKGKEQDPLAKIEVFDPTVFATLNINNLWMWERVDGKSNHSAAGRDGVVFPRGTANAIYQDGIVWGARAFTDAAMTRSAPFDQEIRVMGATYASGSRAGWVEGFAETARAVDPDDPLARIYRIRRDWQAVYWDESGNWTDTARMDAAESYEIPLTDVTDVELNAIVADYLWCWENWPVDLGAPFIDRNGNGVFDPPPPFRTDVPKGDPGYFGPADLISGGYDEPGIAGADPNVPADMVIWNVYNDLFRSKRFGSEPTGMEIQNTVWGYARREALGDVYFRRVKFINKGGVAIDTLLNKGAFYLDDMYVLQWSDPDLGNAGDDLQGCDTLLNMAYTYNGRDIDASYQDFGLPPPSVGYAILQGPAVPSPGDIATFDFKQKADQKNLGMTAFVYFGSGDPYSDPSNSNYDTGAIRWYKLLRGYAPLSGRDTRYNHPPGVTAGTFPYSGDPITGTGHIDGLGTDYSFAPGDRRLMISSGPFQMAPGDTQEVVIALVCGLGADRLSSIAVVKHNSQTAHRYFDSFLSLPNVHVDYKTSHPGGTETALETRVDLQNLTDVTSSEVILKPLFGSESFINMPLYDDGLHNDSLALDAIWGSTVIRANRKFPYNGDLVIHRPSGPDTLPIMNNVRLRPAPQLMNWRLVWENGQQDSSINQDETVHLRFDIRNPDQVNRIDDLDIVNLHSGSEFQRISYGSLIAPGGLADGDDLYLSIVAPVENDSVIINYRIEYDSHSETFSRTFPVTHWEPGPVWGDTLAVYSEKGTTENIIAKIADPSLLTGHRYRISFVNDDDNELHWSLQDETIGEVKLQYGSISGARFFPHPVIDGIQFAVMPIEPSIKSFECVANAAGPLDPPEGAAPDFQGFPSLRPTGRQQATGDGLWMIETHKYADAYFTFQHFLWRSFVINDIEAIIPRDLEMRFTASGSKIFWPDEFGGDNTLIDVPFELWDVGIDPDDPSDDYKLTAYFLDHDAAGSGYDGVFNLGFGPGSDHPGSSANNDPYTDRLYWMSPTDNKPGTRGYDNLIAALAADPSQAASWAASPGDAWGPYDSWSTLTRMVLMNWNGGDVDSASSPEDYNQSMPEVGTVFRIVSTKPNFPGDVLYLDAPVSVSAEVDLPTHYNLFQNYPNPFNPTTQIRFDLARKGRVRLEIFNILGQKVRTLFDRELAPGGHAILWDGHDNAGTKVGSGIYFYRLRAEDYSKSRKMTVLH